MSTILFLLLLALPQQGDVAVQEGARAMVPALMSSSVLPSRAQVAGAIKAIAAKGVPVSDASAGLYADHILKAARVYGVDPYLLVAVARLESNFTGAIRADPRCKTASTCAQSCGITQQYFSGPTVWVVRRCKQLQQDHEQSFLLAAEELAKHAAWCREKIHLDRIPERCILNRYNSGPNYHREDRCHRRWNCDLLTGEARNTCLPKRRRCMSLAKYWTRVMCFQHGARTATVPTRDCSWCWNVQDIPRHFR